MSTCSMLCRGRRSSSMWLSMSPSVSLTPKALQEIYRTIMKCIKDGGTPSLGGTKTTDEHRR